MPDILDEIVARRREDYARLGPTFGVDVPAHRSRALVPFLAESGAILEIKRASPSKGDIAPDLDPVGLAAKYRAAGAKNVSVLTESRYFKGSLADLVAVGRAHPDLSLLRKDFILYEDEIEVAWRAGADAVLLIARILELPALLKLAAAVRARGMTAFIEVREEGDVEKLNQALRAGPVLAGVNSRDLATFRIDPLVPAIMRSRLRCRCVFESGTATPEAARFARRLGFEGILIGEAAAKNPEAAGVLVGAFAGAFPDWNGHFWREMGRRIAERSRAASASGGGTAMRPLVKVCGLTRAEDALLAAELGADLLGFVFAESPRKADRARVIEAATALNVRYDREAAARRPLLVAVVTGADENDPAVRDAFSLVREGILDGVQFHGEGGWAELERVEAAGCGSGMGHYAAVRLGSEEDLALLDDLVAHGEPRVLVDARVQGVAGGTGKAVPEGLVKKVADRTGLWLAGGLGPGNVAEAIGKFSPELVDASSALEASPGIKDGALLRAFFEAVRGGTAGA